MGPVESRTRESFGRVLPYEPSTAVKGLGFRPEGRHRRPRAASASAAPWGSGRWRSACFVRDRFGVVAIKRRVPQDVFPLSGGAPSIVLGYAVEKSLRYYGMKSSGVRTYPRKSGGPGDTLSGIRWAQKGPTVTCLCAPALLQESVGCGAREALEGRPTMACPHMHDGIMGK